MPDVLIGKNQKGDVVTSVDLCIERLQTIERFILAKPEVRANMVTCKWQRLEDKPGRQVLKWEEEATISIAFTNASSKN